MKTIWVLLVIALVLLLWRSREGLEATDKIKAPPYSDDDARKVADAIPQATRDGFIAALPDMASVPDTVKEAQVLLTIKQSLKAFYEETYASAVAPITVGEIRMFVSNAESEPDVPAPPGVKSLIEAALTFYFIDQVVETPTGESALVRSRPGLGNQKLRSEVATYAGVTRTDSLINTMIVEMQRFYDTVYLPDKTMPTQDQIQSFVMESTIEDTRKPKLASVIDYWFTEPAMPGDYRLESGASSEGTTSGAGGGAGSGSGGSGAGSRNSGSPDGKIWGPPFRGTGSPRDYDGNGNGDGDYPTLIGPPTRNDAYWQLNDNLPGSASLGSDVLSGFLPFSRQPGDMDRIPDPYRVSQSYSPSSYSSKNEPVPFLTDFSAFQK